MSGVTLTFKPKSVSKKLLNSLNPRTREVITNRYGLENEVKMTLEAIGKGYGITRERVRQIENFALSSMRKSEEYNNSLAVFDELSDIIKRLGSIVPEDTFFNHISQDKVIHNNLNMFMTLSNKFKKHKEDDNFHARVSVDDAIHNHVHDVLTKVISSVGKDELVSEEEIISRFLSHATELAAEYKADRDIIMRYLRLSKTIDKNQLNEWGHSSSNQVKVRGIKDFAYLILRKAGTPMHFRDVAHTINTTFNKKAHVATCHNELIKDGRFVLVGRGMYGLAEWGRAGGVVRDVINKVLETAAEPLSKEEIVKRVIELRDVKPNTILVNLQNIKFFKKTSGGKYDMVK